MFRELASMYAPSYPKTLVYMLQSTEYKTKPYILWIFRTRDFSKVMHRKSFDATRSATLLLRITQLGILVQIAIGLAYIYLGLWHNFVGGVAFGAAIIIIYPLIWPLLLVVPLEIGKALISEPMKQKSIGASKSQFKNASAIKIAVVGSYGKTTMKELLNTVLSEGLRVAATPANKNVSSSHAQFAKKLKGDEEVLIIEYGEGAPGDVKRFADITKPTHVVITGVAPAHLDEYKTLEAVGKDIFSVSQAVEHKQVYVNGDSPDAKPFITSAFELYDHHGALGWNASEIAVSIEGTSFTLSKGTKKLHLKSGLIGRHHVGYLAFVAAFAMQLGLTEDQVEKGIAKTKPFEHRMQPYQLAGAWIIDDTYNGNLEGIVAGTTVLKDLPGKRKLYVTPGLVDQGEETERVHITVGKLIAEANPDIVVLMKNSVTHYIETGLKQGKFTGKIDIKDDPLEFYTNLAHFVAHDDLVVMQNDWTDNYA